MVNLYFISQAFTTVFCNLELQLISPVTKQGLWVCFSVFSKRWLGNAELIHFYFKVDMSNYYNAAY